MWFVTYQSIRPDEAGIRFVCGETAAIAEGQRLAALGCTITKIAPTSKARIEGFLAGTLSDPEQPVLG